LLLVSVLAGARRFAHAAWSLGTLIYWDLQDIL
jgi:hypothetical protein